MLYQNKNKTVTITNEFNNIGLGFNSYTFCNNSYLIEFTFLSIHIYITNK